MLLHIIIKQLIPINNKNVKSNKGKNIFGYNKHFIKILKIISKLNQFTFFINNILIKINLYIFFFFRKKFNKIIC